MVAPIQYFEKGQLLRGGTLRVPPQRRQKTGWQEKVSLQENVGAEPGLQDIIGESPGLSRVLAQVKIAAPSDATVLILGETGTGKEMIARALHRLSLRHHKSFIKLNYAAIPTGLLESELFGHERGALTGALAHKRGRLELADRGTPQSAFVVLYLKRSVARFNWARGFQYSRSSHFFTTQHHRSGQGGGLVTLDHFER